MKKYPGFVRMRLLPILRVYRAIFDENSNIWPWLDYDFIIGVASIHTDKVVVWSQIQTNHRT